MKLLYILSALIFALYLVGCYIAYRAVKRDGGGDSDYTGWQTFRLTLGSWLTVAMSLMVVQ